MRFAAVSADGPWACGDSPSLGTDQSEFMLSDLRFYVHDVSLISASGDVVSLATSNDDIWNGEGVSLIDLEDGTGPCGSGNEGINSAVNGTVPDGEYAGLTFTLGVPFEQNHQDAAVANPPFSYTAMFWGWQGGYKFMRLDGATTEGNGNRIHLGSTGCEGEIANITSCANENLVTVTLEPFDVATDVVALDLEALFVAIDMETNAEGTPLGCMSTDDPDCVRVFEAFGLGSAPQSAFRVQ
ncbi:MAG: putative repeat protein (TIGR04052 family) [Bradymonadia bacterium]